MTEEEKLTERKLLQRDEVLALMHDCYELLSNGLYKGFSQRGLEFLNYSIRLADIYSDLQGAKDISEVQAIGFHYDEIDEDEEETADDPPDEDKQP